jgi:hypothetical protein
MKARITCNKDHPIGKLFSNFFDLEYVSRSTNFDLTNPSHIEDFVKQIEKYEWTINLSRGMSFGGVNLLCSLESYCNKFQIEHKVFNIGSYISFALLDMPNSLYDVEKVALKYAHRKIANERLFYSKTLDSYLLNLNYIETLSKDVIKNYNHIDVLSLESINNNIKFILDNPSIKELSLQFKQPGNHRINNGIGPILPGMY